MFRKTKTVDTITASLKGVADDLTAHAADQEAQASAKSAKIVELDTQINVHKGEAGRARTIADKIGGLLAA